MPDQEWTGVPVREADVGASTRGRASRGACDAGDVRALCVVGIRDRLAGHSAAVDVWEIGWMHVCQRPTDSAELCSIFRPIRADFQRALAQALDRLCELLPEAGLEQMEIPIGADGNVDRHEVLFPLAATLLSGPAGEPGEGVSHAARRAEQAVEEGLTQLAILLSDPSD